MGAFPSMSSIAGEMSEALVGRCSMFESHNGESLYEVIRKDAVVCG